MQFPPAFIPSIQNCPGFDRVTFENAHQTPEPVTSIRLNRSKLIAAVLPVANELPVSGNVPWCSSGYYLEERPSFTLDPSFHAGAYYVQEASSMFLEQALWQTVDLTAPLKVLDLCAAPGGKSTLIQSLISKQSVLVANEVIKTRVAVLAENITKWGAANVVVTNNDAKDFQHLGAFFDVIVVDAPCSGSGLFRKDPAAVNEWSEKNVALCSGRQQRILTDVLPALKPGGILIYATCSYSEEENEAIADWLCDCFALQSQRLQPDEHWGIVESISKKHKAYGYRFYPGKVKGEGFFITAFTNIAAPEPIFKNTSPKKKAEKLSAAELATITAYLQAPAILRYYRQQEDILALPLELADALPLLQQSLYIRKAGIKLGTIIRNELIPHHELAVSTIISKNLPALDVDKDTALQYLRRQDVDLIPGIKGWALLQYQGFSLGWIKFLHNRVNNYYPKEWRILNR
ncbi:MAG TPA: RNA methyltransferase [Ferruginibacter sp.]|nr:RNA methyltransferase [Ferruginibacter sp.]HMP20770.1 RNA methyltransferase [Ferruginibacter sp.]